MKLRFPYTTFPFISLIPVPKDSAKTIPLGAEEVHQVLPYTKLYIIDTLSHLSQRIPAAVQ